MTAAWVEKKLGEVVELRRGFDLPHSARRAGHVPVLSSGESTGTHDEARVTGPGFVIGRATNLGIPTWSDVDFWPLNTTLYAADFKGNDPRFLYRLFQSLDLTGYDSGSVQPMLNRNYISSLTVRLPPLPEQQAIAEVLGALDDKIAANVQLIRTGEDYLRALFEGRLREGSPQPLGELVDLNPPRRIDVNSAPHIPMQSVPSPGYTFSALEQTAPSGGTRFTNGDTLLARITPCLENGKTAYVACLQPGEVGFGSTEFIVMRSKPGLPLPLSYFIATDPHFRAEAVQRMVGTSGRQRVKAADLVDLELNVTRAADRLESFGRTAVVMINHAQSLSRESQTLAELRDTLLPALMDGTIRVKDAISKAEEAL